MDYYWAQMAINLTVSRYRAQIPVGIATAIDKKQANEVFQILPPIEFQRKFQFWHDVFFTKVLGQTIATCDAFVTPNQDILERTIYIKDKPGIGSGVFFHEFIHYIQHPSFYPQFYAFGGRNPFVLEGVTEYFTREIVDWLKKKRAKEAIYEPNLAVVKSWADGDTSRPGELLAACFQGDLDPLKDLGCTTAV